jgi:hypothetical protein
MTQRRLPSVDWIAFGVGLTALALHYLWPPLISVAALAVFLPALLREAGWLRDADEFTLGVMRRAGFHALLAVVGLFLLNFVLAHAGAYAASERFGPSGDEIPRKLTLGVYLVSYLMQYWGARQGVYRILLGFAVLTLAPLVGFTRPAYGSVFRRYEAGITVATALVLAALALLVRARPRLGGGVLVVLFGVVTLLLAWQARDLQLLRGSVGVFLQVALGFGCSGWALLRESRTARDLAE